MKNIYKVELWRRDQPDSDAYAVLTLPAMPYELLDALEKLHLEAGASPNWEITTYYTEHPPLLESCGSIYELNALAHRLSGLDEQQSTAFSGLLKMEQGKGEPIPISRLIDLAYSTGCCYVVAEARNDGQLGRFYAQNGFIPEAEGLSDGQLELLDFEKIGRDARLGEGGVFVGNTTPHPGGYVVRYTELVEVYKDLDLTSKAPSYTVLLGSEDGSQWELPSVSLPEGRYTCLDCRVPDLICAISDAEDISSIQRMAQKLADMEPKELNAYKALLAVADFPDLDSAEQLMDTLDQYIFSPQFSSPVEVAKGELSLILCEKDAELITPHLNLYQYGEALIQRCGGVLTGYGLIERGDGQPVQAASEHQPQRDGMEMM